MARSQSRRFKNSVSPAILIGMLWVLQLGALGYLFYNLTWDNYWICRGLYRPGLRLFHALGQGFLPGHLFSPFDRTGVMAGFTFASLVYASALGLTLILTQRVLARR